MVSKEWLSQMARMLLVAVITSAVIIGALTLAFSGQGREERETSRQLLEFQEQTYKATLASACVLALPVDPVTGREPALVELCFTQYGLDPPVTHN